jgi:hypothetical protein
MRALVVGLALALRSTALHAQSEQPRVPAAYADNGAQARLFTQPIDSGVLVRMHRSAGDVVIGRLMRTVTPESLAVRYCRYPGNRCTAADSSGLASLPLAEVDTLEVQVGSGAASGGVIGALIGVLEIGLATMAPGDCAPSCYRPSALAAAAAIVGTGVIGAIVGSSGIRWGPAP